MLDINLVRNYGYELTEGENHYILQNEYGNIIIQKSQESNYWRFPLFFYKGFAHTIEELVRILLSECLEKYSLYKTPDSTNFYIQRAVNDLFSFALQDKKEPYHRPVRNNNFKKLSNKVRFIKDYYYDGEGNQEYPDLETAIKARNNFTNKEIKDILTKFKIDLCKVDSINNSVIVSLADGDDFRASCYASTHDDIFTIFENSPAITARLPQAITSDGLLPNYDSVTPNFFVRNSEYNILDNNYPAGGINTVVAFIPEVQDNNMLLCGEIFSSDKFAKNTILLERNLRIEHRVDDLEIIPIGSNVKQWQRVASSKFPTENNKRQDYLFTLPYKKGKLIKVEQQKEDKFDERGQILPSINSTKLTFLIESEVGSCRIVSEHGVKGCTIPLRNSGIVETKYGKIHPDLFIGPNAIKGKSNTIKASGYAFYCHAVNKVEHLRPETTEQAMAIADKIDSVEIVEGIWHSPFGDKIKCYIGIEHIIITDLSNDFKFDKVKIPLEALRFLSVSNNHKLVEHLVENYINEDNSILLKELTNITIGKQSDLHLDLTDETINQIKQLPIDIRSVSKFDDNISFLLDPENEGFSLTVLDKTIRFPSYKFCKAYIHELKGTYYYPPFMKYANLIISNIQRNVKLTTLQTNIEYYLNECIKLLTSKKGLIAKSCSIEVEGGHLRQLPFHLVPKGISVLPHPWYESRHSPFNDYSNYDLWDIGCRNPALWLSMIKSRRVLTYTEFRDYLWLTHKIDINTLCTEYMKGCVLRSPLDCMEDQSDADGDLYPIAIPKKSQVLCRPIDYTVNNKDIFDLIFMTKIVNEEEDIILARLESHFLQPVIVEYQQNWINHYYEGEKKKIKLEPFTIYRISRNLYAKYYASSAIAKMDVAFATVSLWQFNTALEVLILRNEIDQLLQLKLMAIYSAMLQDYVIKGIKHSFDTSQDFHMFLIKNIKENIYPISEVLEDIGLNEDEIIKFFKVANLADSDFIKIFSLLPNGSTTNREVILWGINQILYPQKEQIENIVAKKILDQVLVRS